MPDYVGGLPLGSPDYVDVIPSPQEGSLENIPADPVSPAVPPVNFSYPPQPPGTALIGAGMSMGYVRDRGLRSAPVAGPYGTPAAFWRVHGGMTWKIVTGVFQSIGGPPTLPQPVTNANEVLMDDNIVIPANQVMADGTPVYVRAVQYFFLLQTTPSDTDTLYGCVIQLDTSGLTDNFVDPASYIPNLLGPIPTPAGFTGQAIGF